MTPLKTVMNNVEQTARLQQLRERFEILYQTAPITIDHVIGTEIVDSFADDALLDDLAEMLDGGWPQSERDAVQTAARRYIIARDFNVFDPITSDMLWKLKNGGAL